MAPTLPLAWVRHPRRVIQQDQMTGREQRTVTGEQISDLLQDRVNQRG